MTSEISPIQDVSDTAVWVAHYRALETDKPDSLFKDPLSKVLVGEKGRRIAASMKSASKYTEWSVIIRTNIIDHFIEKLVEGGVDTVINLGAGLDTRPYRLKLSKNLQWIEIDYPHMIAHKDKMLANIEPNVQLQRISLDLADRPKRQDILKKLASKSQKALVITEGVIPYLTEEQVGSLAEDIKAHKNLQYWIAEYISTRIYRYLKAKRLKERMKNAPFQFFPTDWFGFFKKHGWQPLETRYIVDESIRVGRKLPFPKWGLLLNLFASKEKNKAMREQMAYVIYTRK